MVLRSEAEVAIIGAGWYGLVAARTYLRLRPEANLLLIDSDDTVGGVWSKKRLYPNLVAQVKYGLFNYTDTPMPSSGATNNSMVTGEMIHRYLQTYAEDHDLLRRIRFNTFVEKVERCSKGWRLQFKGSLETLEAEKLLVATGVTSIPNLPYLETNDNSIPVIHSRDLGVSFEALQSKKLQHVVVLGAAKSAYDAVYLLLTMGKKVTWVIRPHGAVASTRLMTYLSPSVLNTEGLLAHFFQRSRVGRLVTAKFWDVVNYVSSSHAGYDRGDHVADLKPEIGGKSIFWANSGLGVVTLPNFWEVIHRGDVSIVREEPSKVFQGKLYLASGEVVSTDAVVACTGWGDHFSMFDAALKAEIGLPQVSDRKSDLPEDLSWETEDIDADKSVNSKLPFIAIPPSLKNPQTNNVRQRKWRLFRRSIPIKFALENDRSLAILGQIHTVQTPLVSEMQSFWTILYLLGEIDLPEEAVMRKEIAEWNAWTRKRYLSQGQKFPYSLYDFLPYVDTLCKDLGINSRRKGNQWLELFSPYKPEDFDGFIDEYLARRKDESQVHMRK